MKESLARTIWDDFFNRRITRLEKMGIYYVPELPDDVHGDTIIFQADKVSVVLNESEDDYYLKVIYDGDCMVILKVIYQDYAIQYATYLGFRFYWIIGIKTNESLHMILPDILVDFSYL